MKMNRFAKGYDWCNNSIKILFLTLLSTTLFFSQSIAKVGNFIAQFSCDEEIVMQFNSDVSYKILPSMYSMHAKTDEGRCSIHFMNIEGLLFEGIYDAQTKDGVKVTAVCSLINKEERFVSDSGYLELSEISIRNTLIGTFDFIMKGTKSSDTFRFKGSFQSPAE